MDLHGVRKSEPVRAVTGFLEDFKQFAIKGNMIDLAVGIVIGTAFTNVVKALVDHVFMPALSYVTPEMTYTQWKVGRIEIGAFIGQVVNFIVVAFAVFLLLVKIVGMLSRRQEEKKEEEKKEVPPDIALLTEIRDLLKNRQTSPLTPPEERSDTLT
jgi:large conductance mechanosensitive channel